MSLRFCNKYGYPVSVCIMYYNPRGCPDSKWSKAGWWNIGVNSCMPVLLGNLNNRYYYFHAEASDGAVWSGPMNQNVTNPAFNWCLDTVGTNDKIVGFYMIDAGDSIDFTVNLNP